MSTLYEIVELANGEIALQRSDNDGEPLVTIRFSKESEFFLDDIKADVAKAMIEAGLEIVTESGDMQEEFAEVQPSVLH